MAVSFDRCSIFLACFEAFLLHTKLILYWLVWYLFVPNVTISCRVDFHPEGRWYILKALQNAKVTVLMSSWCQSPQAQTGFKGPDQPQLEPPLTPLCPQGHELFLNWAFSFQWCGQHCWRSVGLVQCWSQFTWLLSALTQALTFTLHLGLLQCCGPAWQLVELILWGRLALSLHSRSCVMTVVLSCDVDSWLDVVAVSGGFLLTLLRCCKAVPWLLCFAQLLPCLSWRPEMLPTEAFS